LLILPTPSLFDAS